MGQAPETDLSPRVVELTADATWPAEEKRELGPWCLRATAGYSHRANSVRTAQQNLPTTGEIPWSDLIAAAEGFYRQRRLPATFHISPASVPGDLDAILAARGYTVETQSEVWHAELKSLGDFQSAGRGEIVLRDDPTSGWLNCALDESIGRVTLREQICRRIPSPRAFASAIIEGRNVARALGAVHRQIAWLYCMATEPELRGQGLGRGLVSKLIEWSLANGAADMYLQVLGDNKPAKSLYSKMGFRKEYKYHYRVLNPRKAGG